MIYTMFNPLSVIHPMNQCHHCQQQSSNTAILHHQGNVNSPQTDLQLLIKISASVFMESDKQFLKVKWKYKNITRVYWSRMVNQIKEYPLNWILHNNENNKLHATWVKLPNIMLSIGAKYKQVYMYNFISINVKTNSFWNQNSVCYIWGLGNNYLTQRDFCGFSHFLFLELCVCYMNVKLFWGIQLIFTQSWWFGNICIHTQEKNKETFYVLVRNGLENI